jgi:hypothetical protein
VGDCLAWIKPWVQYTAPKTNKVGYVTTLEMYFLATPELVAAYLIFFSQISFLFIYFWWG